MKTVRFRDTRIEFQEACLQCLGWAHETYPFEQTFLFERTSIVLQIPGPLCPAHLRRAKMNSQATETQEMSESLRITGYDPVRQIVELTFANDSAAELARRANLDILEEDLSGLKRFQISAHILSHDIRLSTQIQTVVPLERAPSEIKAETLLQPAIDLVMARNLGEGCFYEIDSVQVHELS